APATLAQLISTYGAMGSCWGGSQMLASTCKTACITGLQALQTANPMEPACQCRMGEADCSSAPPPGMALSTDPPPPYGTTPDDTIADFSAMGYRLTPQQTDPSRLPFESIRLSDLRSNPKCRCIALVLFAAWSTPDNAVEAELINAARTQQ